MTQATAGKTVAFHYTGTLADGTIFDSSEGRDPLSFTMGQGQIIAGLEAAFDGMGVGDEKTVTVPADQAYGPYEPDGVQRIPRSTVPPNIELSVGMQLQMTGASGNPIPVVVSDLTEDEVELDGNHPLAGKDLTFAVKIVSVE